MNKNKINNEFLEKIHNSYLDSPNSVDPSWRKFFSPEKYHNDVNVIQQVPKISESINSTYLLKAMDLLRSYRVNGYLNANLDPIGVLKVPNIIDLNPNTHGLEDLSATITLDGNLNLNETTISEMIELLKKVYCGSIGIQYMHLENLEERRWIQEKFEKNINWRENFSAEIKKFIIKTLIKAEDLEDFIHLKFKGAKRFSIEGAETTIIAMEAIIEEAAKNNTEEIVIGMAHRGRLNFLTNVLGKKYRALFSEFYGNFPEFLKSSGDVKYHLGTSCDRQTISGKDIHLSLNSNPSHLEAVNPVVLGKVRAKQDAGRSTMAVLLHGDASFSGQGVVYESMILEELEDYRTGGAIHLIINNQIGFTTSPNCASNSPFPSFIGKAFDAPIFHVNGDDPEAVMHASSIATEFRNTFKKDVIIDIVSYRRYGHNEGDEPRFTQPKMYNHIDSHEKVTAIYGTQLIQDGVISRETLIESKATFKRILDFEFEESKHYKSDKKDWFESEWAGFEIKAESKHPKRGTGVEKSLLKSISEQLTALPDDFNANNKVVRVLEERKKAIMSGQGINWGNAEALAFATLLQEDVNIRLAGQDCKRGTFSHRHAVLVDQDNEDNFIPLNSIAEAKILIVNSPLSEYAALGFEYGYSSVNPQNLAMWEAQFGDFANGAQIIIDQFISSAESKWLRASGIVLLLPHGYEGQGPEHSSARLERFLQLCGDNNMQIVNCTTPANYFHILRRQVSGNIRKPLIIFTPKSLLRHKLAVSNISDFTENTFFQEIIVNNVETNNIRKIIFCSGKVYYDLLETKEKENIKDVLIIRVEQIHPFPEEDVLKEINKFPDAKLVWCQEEPKNMGAWFFVHPIIEILSNKKMVYAGREQSASPATGYLKVHNDQQEELIREALS
jgi:2-oxoglutarate dehydrogenase E1 component